MSDTATITHDQLAHIWGLAGLPVSALAHAKLDITGPVLPSSYHVAAAATATIAAAGLAASELWRLRSGGETQTVSVSSRHAEVEFHSEGYLAIHDTAEKQLWGPIADLYQCGDGRWVRIHANYPHHEAGVLDILKCEPTKAAVQQTLQSWTAQDFEDACGEQGLVVFMMRSPQEWATHGQAQALERLPLFDIERIGDAPPEPLPTGGTQPLSGISALDLTRVIAGPVCGRTLAAHGADVLRVSADRLPRDPLMLEIDGGRGKRSAFIDLKEAAGRTELEALVRKADVFAQGYRPGAMDANGFSPERLAELRPGIVSVSVSAWGHEGPWSHRRGFDSLVQTASGINHGEAHAAGIDGPKPLPCQALDFASGYLMALGAMAGLYKRATEGGSWRVRVALARTGRWLQSLGRLDDGLAGNAPTTADIADLITTFPESGYGRLDVISHPIHLDKTPAVNLPPVPYPQ